MNLNPSPPPSLHHEPKPPPPRLYRNLSTMNPNPYLHNSPFPCFPSKYLRFIIVTTWARKKTHQPNIVSTSVEPQVSHHHDFVVTPLVTIFSSSPIFGLPSLYLTLLLFVSKCVPPHQRCCLMSVVVIDSYNKFYLTTWAWFHHIFCVIIMSIIGILC